MSEVAVGAAYGRVRARLGGRLLPVTRLDANYLKGLIAGYWHDAGNDDGAALVSDVEQFLARVDESQVVGGRGVGIGGSSDLTVTGWLSGAVTGLGLQVDSDLVHLAVFPQPEVAC